MAKLKAQQGATQAVTQDPELATRLIGTRFGREKVTEDAYVMLYRMDDVKKRWVYHGRLQPEEYTEDYISARFGGGQWRGQLKENNGKGVFEITGTDSFDLPGEYREPAELPGAPKLKREEGAAPQVGTLGPDGRPLTAQQALDTQVALRLMEALNAPAQRTSLLAEIAAVLTPLVPVLEKLVQKREVEKRDVSPLELVKEMANVLKSLAPAPPPPTTPSPLSEVTKAMKELMGIKDMIAPPTEREEAADPVAASLPKILEYLAAAASGRAPNVATPKPAPPQPALSSGMPENINQLLPWQQILHQQKRRLLQFASTGVEPDFAAEMAVRLMPQNIVGYVREFLLMPDHVEKAMNTIPELRAFQQWTEDFFDEACNLILGEAEEEGPGEEVVDMDGEQLGVSVPPPPDELEAARRRPRRPRKKEGDGNGAA